MYNKECNSLMLGEFIISIIILLIDVLITFLIGFAGLQEILSLWIYFVPSIITISFIFYFAKNLKQKRNIILETIIVFLTATFIVSLIIYYNGFFVSSIIASCVFVAIFYISPLIISYIVILLYSIFSSNNTEGRFETNEKSE